MWGAPERGPGTAIVALLFLVSLAVSGYHVVTHEAPILATLLGQVSLLVLSVAFGLAGWYAFRSVDTVDQRRTIGVWAGGGYVFAAAVSGAYTLHQYFTPEVVVPAGAVLFEVAFVALVGGVAGTGVGLERARRERTIAELEAATSNLERIQADVRTEKERFESLFQNAPSAIADLRYEDGTPTVVRANDAFDELLDDPDRPVEGRDLFEVVPLRETNAEDAVSARVAGDELYEGEVTVDRADGLRHYKLRVIPYDVGKSGERAFALYTDVTELRRTQRELEASVDRLEASNDRLEQFAYAASHDLQEPLRTVSNYLRLIEDRHGDDLGEDGEEFLEFAVDAADRMREMIDGLLEYSRVETRGDPFELVELDEVLEDVRTDLRKMIEDNDAEITVEPLPRVEGDGNQLRQVFQNLIENAVEYGGEGTPRVTVSADRREEPTDEWVIAVSDDGIGIPPEHQEEIFQVFQRLHGREEHAGTGIGLALCRRIVERHGGEMWVESEPGEGSTFFVTLPAADEPSDPRSIAESGPPSR